MSKAIDLTWLEHTASELRAIAARTDDGRVVRRLLAIAFVLDDYSRAKAAQACGMDRQILRDWIVRFNESGIPGLTDRTVPGRPPALLAADLAQVKKIVLDGPDPEKHGVARGAALIFRALLKRSLVCGFTKPRLADG